MKDEEFKRIAKENEVQIRGIHGEHSDTSSGVFDISNLRRLGRNEVELVQDMYDGVKAMIKAEKSLWVICAHVNERNLIEIDSMIK